MDPEELALIDHTHCLDCYRVDCGKRIAVYPTKCPIVTCELECGAKFHACKHDEHRTLCGFERVQCINHVNGCPLFIQRDKLRSHLERCPASVVYCTMEWNRWPVYSHERQSRVPFLSDNLHAQYGQLDVALALRDQRMLNAALKAPRSTRRVLRNNLTQRFPAVPIRLNSSSGPDLEMNDPAPLAKPEDAENSGTEDDGSAVGQSFGNEIFKATQSALVGLTEALKSVTGYETGNDHEDIPEEGTAVSEINGTCTTVYKDTNGNESEDKIKTNGEIHGEINCLELDDHDLGQYNVKKPVDGPTLSFDSDGSDDQSDMLTVYPNPAVEIPQPPCPAPLLTLKETLALDLNLECITRYHAKPRSMYTFLCAQEFRRDEYSYHFKNVHDEIHGGLNGWLEQRCPLSQYGCTFSIRRLYPIEKGAKVIHNTVLESFGIKPKEPALLCDNEKIPPLRKCDAHRSPPTVVKGVINSGSKTSKTPSKFLLSNVNDSQVVNGNLSKEQDSSIPIESDVEAHCNDLEVPVKPDFNTLPFEVLRHIACFLDGHSLCNVAITSRLLRDVACSILEEKGIVIHQWGKRQRDGQTHWEISHKRWIFSTAFNPVERWGFEDYVPLGEHLKTCPFYHRSIPSKPHHLPNMKCGRHHSNNFYDVMKRMYPDFQVETNSQESDCQGQAGLC